jgi:hypothetical protein
VAAAGEEEVALRDGSKVLIRPVSAGDKELFVRGWERFGEESRYRCFMGAEIDVELPCEPASGLGAALRAAAKGLVGLRP